MSEKISLVTGAASGFGYEIVKKLAGDPTYNPIYATDVDPRLHQLFAQNERVITMDLDVRNPQQIADVTEHILEQQGVVDILVNNAGVMNSGLVETYVDEEGNPSEYLRDMWETNLRGPILLMDAVLGNMRSRLSGKIVNITSCSEHNRTPFRKGYADYKAVLSGVTFNYAQQEAPYGIQIYNVKPGMHKTAIERGIWTKGSDDMDVMTAQNLYKWWRKTFGMDPKNVADAVYRIAQGEITDHEVFVGWDANFMAYMDRHLSNWEQLFNLGFKTVYYPVKFGVALRRKLG